MDDLRPFEPLMIADGVRAVWDLDTAAERGEPGNLFPSRVGWVAARQGRRVSAVLGARVATGYQVEAPEVVRIPKLDRTTRPGSDLAVEDQMLYAAVVAAVRERIEPGFVDFGQTPGIPGQSYEAFERFPLEEPGTAYVLEADVAAFFQFVSHELLGYELVGLTGWAEGASAVISLLSGWSRDARGLPQGPWPSGVLADIYISRAARALHRAGLRFSRHSDDFRIAAGSWTETRDALLRLEGALHDLGLVLASGKLKTPKLETYRRQLDRVDDPRLQSDLSARAFRELRGTDYETEVVLDFLVSHAEATRARQVIDEQLEPVQPSVIGTRLIRRALAKLASSRSPVGLSAVPLLLARYPHLTPNVARYLRRLMGTQAEVDALQTAVGWLEGGTYHYPWQVGWLLHALNFAQRGDAHLADVAQAVLYSPATPWFAKGQAAISLGLQGSLPTLGSFVSTYEQSPRATRPDFVAAVAVAAPRWRTQFLRGVVAEPILAEVAQFEREARSTWL